jgi:HEPN domain-containing protein
MADSVPAMLLRSAADDVAACKVLVAAPGIADSVIGFHAQQACEKCLKAVLGTRGVVFSRTHDLVRLMEQVAAPGPAVPEAADWIDELNPYAVQARYGLSAPGALDRQRTVATIDELLAWACLQVGAAGTP